MNADDEQRGDPRPRRRSRAPLLAIVVVLLLLGTALWFVPMLTERTAFASMDSPERAARELVRHPELGPTMTVLRDRFPDDFATLTRSVAAEASKRDPIGVENAVRAAIVRINAEQRGRIAAAPDAAIERYRDRYKAALAALADRPADCFAFAAGSWIGLDDMPTEPRRALHAVTVATLDAIADGRDTPAAPADAAIDPAAFEAALRATGIPQASLALLMGERAPDPEEPAVLCQAEVHFYRALDALPPAQANGLVRQGLAPGGA